MLISDGQLRSVEDPRYPLTSKTLLDVLNLPSATDSGESVTESSAYRMSAVFRSIALVSGVVGMLPVHAYRRTETGRERISTGPAALIAADPHEEKTAFEVKEYMGQSLMSNGNSYSFKNRDGARIVREIEPIPPSTVRVERNERWVTPENRRGKRFYVEYGTREEVYTPWDILHIPGLSYDGLTGLSPIGMARQTIGLGLAAQRFGAKMFDKGGLIQGVLESDQELTEEQAKEGRRRIEAAVKGSGNQWGIPVLGRGMKYHAIALPPADAQYIETQKLSVTEIARLFGLPPHLIGDVEKSTSWGTGIEHQNMQMLQFMLGPFLTRIEQRFTKEVILDRSIYIKFNVDALLRPDTKARFEAYAKAVNNGWMNPDEVRELEDREPIPDGLGQTYWRPANLTTLADTSTGDDTSDPNEPSLDELLERQEES